jgi:hypothetical protein
VFKKADQQGRSERGGEAYSFSPARPELPEQLFPESYIEPLSDARTKLGEGRVSARRGWVGEKRDFFNTLLARNRRLPDSPYNRLILRLRQPMHT